MEKQKTMADLLPGEKGTVRGLKAKSGMRRRLQDLGLIEGTKIACVGQSPLGDPRCFMIRGAAIAIREADCEAVVVEAETRRKKTIALAGNPNVGKSTLFNALTGLRQHTGNWAGKTVGSAFGTCENRETAYQIVDLPGTYSLLTRSAEEAAARDFLCFERPDAVIVVCDATCLTRNLNLALQIMELCPSVILCVNMMDEAKARGIRIDLEQLSARLGVPVVGICARQKRELKKLLRTVDAVLQDENVSHAAEVSRKNPAEADGFTNAASAADPSAETARAKSGAAAEGGLPDEAGAALKTAPQAEGRAGAAALPFRYPAAIEAGAEILAPVLAERLAGRLPARWLALRVLEGDEALLTSIRDKIGIDWREDSAVRNAKMKAERCLRGSEEERKTGEWEFSDPGTEEMTPRAVSDVIAETILRQAERVCDGIARVPENLYHNTDGRVDRLLTGRYTAYPCMLLLLAVVFWVTIVGANYPSRLLSAGFNELEGILLSLMAALRAPDWLSGCLIQGAYRVLAWVVAVMLPPMAIFFPFFTLLEDMGYLPRVAYNLDKPFQRCNACGKQALTMCMGFGCNAAGVTGCRIIDSPRERMLAILTNSFVPCNGRFPALIAVLTMFFAGCGEAAGAGSSALAALLLTTVILGGVAVTLLVTGILSKTLLRGLPSFFTLELPPYRVPQVGSVIVRSVLDRTLFVLARAAAVAAPAGLLIWLLANVNIGSVSVLQHIVSFLEPVGTLLGLDGAVLAAFILGLPANEIVIPIVIMIYLTQGNLSGMENLVTLRALLVENGWTEVTALCFMLFSLMHWPCSTTLLTVYKETGSWKWTGAAALIPTLCGGSVCILVSGAAALLFGI